MLINGIAQGLKHLRSIRPLRSQHALATINRYQGRIKSHLFRHKLGYTSLFTGTTAATAYIFHGKPTVLCEQLPLVPLFDKPQGVTETFEKQPDDKVDAQTPVCVLSTRTLLSLIWSDLPYLIFAVLVSSILDIYR